MSGYSKRMREIAAAWHQANPDLDATELRLPRRLDMLRDVAVEIEKTEQLRERARREGNDAVVRRTEEILTTLQRIASDPDLERAMGTLQSEVNQTYKLSQSKLVRPSAEQATDEPLWYAAEAPWLLAWARDGYNVFDLSPDFVAAMLLTDPTTVDLSELKLPFRGMLVMIPDGFAVGAEGASYTKIHVTEVADSRTIDGRSATDGERCPAIVIYATDGTHLLVTIAPRGDLSWDAIEELPDDVTIDRDREARATIQRVVFGALAYATAVDRAITERFPAPKKHREREQPAIAHWTIGREIKISPDLVRIARGGAREIAFRIKSRFVVRGHYRNQAHGPNRSLRTSRWIMPFFKGPEEGAQLVHTYKPALPEDES